jgi:hypothetical protein
MAYISHSSPLTFLTASYIKEKTGDGNDPAGDLMLMSESVASESAHSGKPRSGKAKKSHSKKSKDYWGRRAESLIQRFGGTKEERRLLRGARLKLSNESETYQDAVKYAGECALSRRLFLTGLAIAKLYPDRVSRVAEALEQLTHTPSRAWVEQERGYIEIRLKKFLLPNT